MRNDRRERAPPARPRAARRAGAGVRARPGDARLGRGRRRRAALRRRRRQARPLRRRLTIARWRGRRESRESPSHMSENGESRGERADHNRRMTIDGDAAYQVLLARDARFDGRLFVGVTSTGIYCRPICRVRTPARRNCRFFATPAQAEAASFRPCLKCRPEIAPGPGLPWTVMDASRTLARQAASALDDVAADGEAPSVAAHRRAARRQRPPPAPHLLGRARRHAAAVPADAPPAARQAAPDRHAAAGRADRAGERLSQPAPLQRGVRSTATG